MIRGSPVPASSSRVAGTAPSTEFSSGTSAPSASPARTASMARVTFAWGSSVASAAIGNVRSAAWANVPAGPRKARRGRASVTIAERIGVQASARDLAGLLGLADGATALECGLDCLLLLGRELLLAGAATHALGVHAGVAAPGYRGQRDAVALVVEQRERERHAPGDVVERVVAHERDRSEEHTSELQSRPHLVYRLLLENKKSPTLHVRLFVTSQTDKTHQDAAS